MSRFKRFYEDAAFKELARKVWSTVQFSLVSWIQLTHAIESKERKPSSPLEFSESVRSKTKKFVSDYLKRHHPDV